ncbi:MAG: thioredoxin domain-containing protein [Bacteroidia bacterium]
MISDKKFTNALINESSPYLLQHAHNPVSWHAWNDETLAKAKHENKLLLISIGYSACHWCHVMEHESFEDEQVAKLMNENFINIKVDREERPDIDQLYMHAVQLMTGQGGWPLNCIALPDGRPVYGGTYFRKTQWMEVLVQVAEFYKRENEKCIEYAEELAAGVNKFDSIIKTESDKLFSKEELNSCFEKFEKQFDNIEGGPNKAPKFPIPVNYIFLLRHYFHTKNEACLSHVLLTLRKLAYGGIYDQAGGGFARYSTDKLWKVPHFEKMLYDNAQLISLYTEAFQLTKENLFKEIVYETIGFVKRELTSPDGSFYSALDADSEGVEGKFYVWTKPELTEILNHDAELFFDYYNLNEVGYWEHDNYILLRKESDEAFAARYGMDADDLKSKIKSLKEQVLNFRDQRIKPGLDNKQLTSWNALMLKALIDAYLVFDEQSFLETALKNADFIVSKISKPDGSLFHNYNNDKATINGFLEDYCFVIEAFISIHTATADEKWLRLSLQLMNYCIENFYDEKSGMFYFTSANDEKLFSRKMEVQDNVIPASNSSIAKSLFLLGKYFSDEKFITISKQMLLNVKEDLLRYPYAYANWAQLMQYFTYNFYEVCFTGNESQEKFQSLNKNYSPNKLICLSSHESELPLLQNRYIENRTLIYVCSEGACQLPVENIDDTLQLLN